MKTAIVIAGPNLKFQTLAEAAKGLGRVDLQSEIRMVVEGDFGVFAFNLDLSIADDFDASETARVTSTIKEPQFFLLEYSGSAAANAAIQILPDQCPILIDNDHGLVADRPEILARINRSEDWTAHQPTN
ncbi:MAG: hypothetical protein H0W72_04710 [Planctomycetes bacterium]|nr:hypothetical protein [Planctomycetota bacterium]